MLRLILTVGLLAGADAGFGRKKEKDGASRMGEELNAEAEQNSGEGQTGNAREWELENMERHKTGELNSAELGMANMQQALKDPSVLAETMKMMQDPEAQRKMKEMMSDPTFQAQAQQAMAAMKQSGGLHAGSNVATPSSPNASLGLGALARTRSPGPPRVGSIRPLSPRAISSRVALIS